MLAIPLSEQICDFSVRIFSCLDPDICSRVLKLTPWMTFQPSLCLHNGVYMILSKWSYIGTDSLAKKWLWVHANLACLFHILHEGILSESSE